VEKYSTLLLFYVCLFSLSAKAGSGPHFHAERGVVWSKNGDLWWGQLDSSGAPGSWQQLTNTTSWEGHPVWLPDGQSIVFSSDRSGVYQLYRLDLTSGTTSLWAPADQHQTQPSVSATGTLVWVQGLGPAAVLWHQKPGAAAELIPGTTGGHSPSIQADGTAIAFIRTKGPTQELCLLGEEGTIQTLKTNRRPEFPAWSPDGQRLIYSSRDQQPGVYLTDAEGSFHNLVVAGHYLASWSGDGQQLVLASLRQQPPYHNGDQDPDGLRYLDQTLLLDAPLRWLPAPSSPVVTFSESWPQPAPDFKDKRSRQFQELIAVLDEQFVAAPLAQQAAWEALKQDYGQRLTAVQTDAELEQLCYDLLKARPFLRAEKRGQAGVSSAHPLASAAGTEILAQGGNVVDAAVAVSFALGVVEPDASGMGGYGEMLIYLQGMEAPTCIEFLTRVPEAAGLSNATLNPVPRGGPVVVNVPGTVAGMELAWQRYGSQRLAWKTLLAPAIRLAEEGFVLDASLATTLYKEQMEYRKYPASKALFFKGDQPLGVGDTLRNPDLAWTLRQVAEGGAAAFYRGAVAEKLVQDLHGKGNAMSMTDMARYYAVERVPVQTTYRGHTVYSGPPPVSGGAGLIGRLNLLEAYDNPGGYQDDPAALHALVEAWKLTPSGSGRIADPGLWPVDLSPFTDKAAAQQRWSSCFDPTQALLPGASCVDTRHSASWGADKVLEGKSNTGTTAFAVADAEGNMVSVTQTLGTWGGNFYVTPGLGFLYNDKLGSYSRNPSDYNARIPFARNVTSITPSLVFEGVAEEQRPLLAVGAAGNAWITSAVYHIITGVVDNGLSPQQALEQPRVLVGARFDPQDPKRVLSVRLQAEQGFAPEVVAGMEARGHTIQWTSRYGRLRMGYAAAVMVGTGQVVVGADPRRSGEAMVLPE